VVVRSTDTGATEEYDGTTWTSVNPGLNTARIILGGAGTSQTAALAFWWKHPPRTTATEEYDGTTWTTSPGSLSTAKMQFSWSRNTSCSFSFWWRR
jgi:hypothetical protein